MTAPSALTCDYAALVNVVGKHLFGLDPATTDLITESLVSTSQRNDILNAISKGLKYVYGAHRWSFLRPPVTITTYAPYATGTVTITALGVVTGVGTTFPSYSASAGGWMSITGVGSYAIATYVSGTGLTLSNYDGGAVTTGATFTIWFDTYAMPTGVDSLETDLTYPRDSYSLARPLRKISELDIRRMVARNSSADRPQFYAETTKTFDPTVGSASR